MKHEVEQAARLLSGDRPLRTAARGRAHVAREGHAVGAARPCLVQGAAGEHGHAQVRMQSWGSGEGEGRGAICAVAEALRPEDDLAPTRTILVQSHDQLVPYGLLEPTDQGQPERTERARRRARDRPRPVGLLPLEHGADVVQVANLRRGVDRLRVVQVGVVKNPVLERVRPRQREDPAGVRAVRRDLRVQQPGSAHGPRPPLASPAVNREDVVRFRHPRGGEVEELNDLAEHRRGVVLHVDVQHPATPEEAVGVGQLGAAVHDHVAAGVPRLLLFVCL